MVGPDEEVVAGRRPVEEAFVARRDAHRLLVVPARRAALERIVLHATNLRIPIVEVEGGTLTALTGFDGHQGVALVVGPRAYATVDEVLAFARERGEPPFVLVLDSLEDPQNVGTLLRSAEAAGVHGVIFPTHRQAPLTPAAVKASSGAVEHLLLAPVDDLPSALADLHVAGVRIVGSEAEAPLTARQTDLRGPVAIIVGSEGQGLGPAIRRRCDAFMRIPMVGAVGSLNAAVAGSILVFEAAVQRDPEGTRPRREPTARPGGAGGRPAVERPTSAVADRPETAEAAGPPEPMAEAPTVPEPSPTAGPAAAEPPTVAEAPTVPEPPTVAEAPTVPEPPSTRPRRVARASRTKATAAALDRTAGPSEPPPTASTQPEAAAPATAAPRRRAPSRGAKSSSAGEPATTGETAATGETSGRAETAGNAEADAHEGADDLLPGGPSG